MTPMRMLAALRFDRDPEMSVLVAVALDTALAEPPARAPPRRVDRALPRRGGAAGPGAAARPGRGRRAAPPGWAARWPRSRWRGSPSGSPGGSADRAAAVVRGVALWPLLSSRMLLAEVAAVEAAVRRDLGAGRTALSRIVSRDTSGLTEEEVRGAAVASLAENLSDSVVAPLVWYAAAGLPGAALHRYANTADACWGYRTPALAARRPGRRPGRRPAQPGAGPAHRRAAGPAAPTGRGCGPRPGARSSPNAGWPMAAMALRLDVALGKRGHYALNAGGAAPGPDHVAAALRVARRTTLLATVLAAVVDHLTRSTRGGRR